MAQLANLTTTLALESASFVNGIEQSRGAVRRLLQQLDPAAAAQAKFNRQMDLAERGLKSGQLSADLYASVVGRLKQNLDAASASGSTLTQTSGQMRSGFQQLGYQLNDIATGLSTGQKVSIVFAQQFSQVIQAVQLMNTSTTGLLGVLGGPWGAVFAASLTAAAPFVAKIFEGNTALDDEVDKLKKSEQQTEITRKAHDLFKETLEGVKQAIQDAKDADQKWQDAQKTSAQIAVDNAKKNYDETVSIREKTKAKLDDQIADLKILEQSARGGGSTAETNQFRVGFAQQSIAGLQELINQQNDAIKAQQTVYSESLANLAQETAKAMNDPIERIKNAYEGSDGLIAQAKARLVAENATKAVMQAQLGLLDEQERAAIKAEQDREAAAKKLASDNRQSGRTISLAEAESIVQSIGGVITSATRSFQKQTELYNNYLAGKGPLAAKPGSSDHETGNALDIAKTPGISLGTIREAFNAAGVSIKQLLDEGNHFHVAWKAGADDAAKAEKKLDDTLKGVQTSLDPAAAAATNYQKALSDIATLQASGKLSPGKAKEYADAARDAFIDARAKAFSFKDIDFDDLIKQSEEADKKAQEEADRASKRADQAITDQKAQIGYAQQALGITTLNNNQRDIELARLSAIAELERLGTGYTEQQRQTLIAGAEALEKVRQQQELVNNSMQELNQFGDQFLSDVLNPDNWSSWGDLAKSVLKDIESEFIKLALLNPLKNALFGENNATLGSIGGLLGGIFKSGDSNLTAAADSFWSGGTPGFANGGSFMFGGKGGVDQNLLSLNGSPIARVSKGETATIGKGGSNDNRPIEIHIVGEESSAFVPRVTAISGVTSARVVGGAQKAQTKAAGRRLGR